MESHVADALEIAEFIRALGNDLEKAREALREINQYNLIHNDLEAYLYEVTKWGLGVLDEKPKLEDFGLK